MADRRGDSVCLKYRARTTAGPDVYQIAGNYRATKDVLEVDLALNHLAAQPGASAEAADTPLDIQQVQRESIALTDEPDAASLCGCVCSLTEHLYVVYHGDVS
ncbi:MAG: hypothetical protein PVJ57_13375 [Phycisphaerae bacterium]|jgi:hypothetical protein